jgi:hypothetical protein
MGDSVVGAPGFFPKTKDVDPGVFCENRELESPILLIGVANSLFEAVQLDLGRVGSGSLFLSGEQR